MSFKHLDFISKHLSLCVHVHVHASIVNHISKFESSKLFISRKHLSLFLQGRNWQSRILSLYVFHFAMLQRDISSYCCTCWRRQWHPTPVLLPRKSHGRRSLVGCNPWGRQSRARLSDFTFTFHFHALEKEMATHSSVLAWRIPGTGSLVGCRLWGRTESDMTKVTQQQQQQQQHTPVK